MTFAFCSPQTPLTWPLNTPEIPLRQLQTPVPYSAPDPLAGTEGVASRRREGKEEGRRKNKKGRKG